MQKQNIPASMSPQTSVVPARHVHSLLLVDPSAQAGQLHSLGVVGSGRHTAQRTQLSALNGHSPALKYVSAGQTQLQSASSAKKGAPHRKTSPTGHLHVESRLDPAGHLEQWQSWPWGLSHFRHLMQIPLPASSFEAYSPSKHFLHLTLASSENVSFR